MYIARISRQKEDKVVKDEIRMEELEGLLYALGELYDNDVLEICIYREDRK